MKFTCTQENLSEGLHIVVRAASRNIALPILNNVLIVAEQGVVRLQTTNLEVAVTTQIRAKVESEGRYTVNSRLISDYVAAMKNAKLEVESIEDGLRIKTEQSESVLKGLPAEDFPVLPVVAPETEVVVPTTVFRTALHEVIFAAANDDTRPEISGVFLYTQDDHFIMAATDSYRLAERKVEVAKAPTKALKMIVPGRAGQEILRILDQGGEEATIVSDEKQALVRSGETEVVTRLIEGQYPDYQQIIPSKHDTDVTISKSDFIDAVRAASLFAQPGINDLTFRVASDGKVKLSSSSAQSGRHTATIEAEVSGPEKEVVFNFRYLLEGAQSLPGEQVRIELSDPQAPGVIRATSTKDAVYLIMPIRQ